MIITAMKMVIEKYCTSYIKLKKKKKSKEEDIN